MKKHLSLSLLCVALFQSLRAVSYNIDSQNMHFIEKAWSVSSGGSGRYPSGPSYYSITLNGRFFRGERPWELRWDMIKDAFDYKGKKILEVGCCLAMPCTFLMKYRGAASATGVDVPDRILQIQGDPHKMKAARWVDRAFKVNVNYLQIDLNTEQYETKIGYDYDIVFCMSLLNWVTDKQRLLRYLSHFKHVIYEGHNNDQTEIARFRSVGFTHYKILGKADKNRTVIYFSK